MQHTDLRFAMFSSYLNELQDIKGLTHLTQEELTIVYQSFISDDNTRWIDVFADDTNETLIGFLLVGYPPNCHPNADYYISESYIIPMYRGHGYMSAAVSNFVNLHPGVYCLFVLKNNISAYLFWHKIFSSLGYTPCSLIDVGAGDIYCEQHGFRNINKS